MNLLDIVRWSLSELSQHSDAVDAFVKLAGLLAIVGGGWAYYRQHSNLRRAEITKRQLDLQRELLLQLLGSMAEQSEELGRFSAPGYQFKSVPGLGGTLLKVQSFAQQKTVEAVLSLSTTYLTGLAKLTSLKIDALQADEEFETLRQAVGKKNKEIVDIHRDIASGPVDDDVPWTVRDKNDLKAAQDQLAVLLTVTETAKEDRIQKWESFRKSFEATVDDIATGIKPVVIAVRHELSVETDADVLISLMEKHQKAAKTAALKMIDLIKRMHLES